ncbi:MAG: radical SAM protein [Deltaproteobacteria bacterium]|nr:radical SAM protein [Deltaproteobacteria bacterium]NIS77321.1 radical SAM protein [Deltaproteobacteria bacterium]
MSLKATRDERICARCLFPECRVLVPCPVDFQEEDCAGCGACAIACPFDAVTMIAAADRGEIRVEVDGEGALVPENTTVKRALEHLGVRFGKLPDGILAPCGTGGCFSCAVEIDGVVKPCCVTKVHEGARIRTRLPGDHVPRRIVGGFMGHTVGGVGTPWNLKARGVIEVALFAAGCNFRCPQCQNWTIACRGKESFDYRLLTPQEAAERISGSRRKYGVDRMAISGGECTLNPPWLLAYLRALKEKNPGDESRFHVDTNGSLLSPEYIDELVGAGMTDVGIDLKALQAKTFMRVTGLTDEALAGRYKENAWQAVRYISETYRDKVFLGIGIPYNERLISLEEIAAMGREIFEIDPAVQVCALDYRPEFKRTGLPLPTFAEMREVHGVLKGTGLSTVLCQTVHGHIGP